MRLPTLPPIALLKGLDNNKLEGRGGLYATCGSRLQPVPHLWEQAVLAQLLINHPYLQERWHGLGVLARARDFVSMVLA